MKSLEAIQLPIPDEIEPADVISTARSVMDPSVDLTVPGLAKATGLTADKVRTILTTPAYSQQMEQQFKLLLMGALMRGMMKMDEIIHSKGKTKTADRVNAFRGLSNTYNALASTLPKNDSSGSREDFRRAMQLLEQMNPSPKKTA